MKWIELTVHTTSEAADLVASVLFESGGNGVAIADKKDLLDFQNSGRVWDYLDEALLEGADEQVLVKGFVPADCWEQKYAGVREALETLRQNAGGALDFGSLEIVRREIDDEDWVNVWKKHYKPIPLKDVTVCPEWIDYAPRPGEVVVKIDPGMAFGTGEHETTSMCIELMQEIDLKGKRVLDVGCGSGILGITALLLGAGSVFMTDIDPVAVRAAELNAARNGVSDRLEIRCQNLLDDREIKGDVLLVNIVADVLIDLSRGLSAHMTGKSELILSGIIRSREQDVLAAYRAIGLEPVRIYEKGEWAAIRMRQCQN